MSMELRGQRAKASKRDAAKPHLSALDALLSGAIPAESTFRVIDENIDEILDDWGLFDGVPGDLDFIKDQAPAPPVKVDQGSFFGSSLFNSFQNQGREVSTLKSGNLQSSRPGWFPETEDEATYLIDAHRYALGADIVLAYDTEYQALDGVLESGTDSFNEILSYQICAYSAKNGNWCEYIIHVKGGDRLTFEDIVDATRLHLSVKPKGLAKDGVLVVSHFGAAEWSALADRKQLTGTLQLIRKVPVTLGWSDIELRINNRKQRCKIRVMDTYLLAPDNNKSLAGLGQTVGIKKVDLPEGAIENMAELRETDRDLFEEYGINDSRITIAYLIHITDLVQREIQLEDLPLTVGGISTRAFVNSMSQTEYLAAFGLVKRKKYQKTVIEPGKMREWVDGLFRDGFCGGLNNATPGVVKASDGRVVFDIDFTSAYPTAAATIPCVDWSNVEQIKNTPELEMFDGSEGTRLSPISLAYVRFEFPEGTIRPCIPIHTGKFGLIYPLRGEGYATTPELLLAREKGAKIDILQAYALPVLRDGNGRAQPLFAPFLAEMIARRRTFKPKTLPNLLYKLICNSLYGKLAQGVKTRFIRSFDRRDQLPDSAVTCPAYAAATTGIVRAALIGLQDAIEEVGGTVHSATTDGCMASFPGHPDTHQKLEDIPGLIEAIDRKSTIKLMRAGLRNMGLPDVVLEVKAVGDSCEVWKTRGYAICKNGEVQHLAKAGHQLGLDDLRAVADDESIQKWTMKSLASAQAIYDGKYDDIVSIKKPKRANLDFDFKLIPDRSGKFRAPVDLDEFLDWRESADRVRKVGLRATSERVALAVGGHSLHGDSRATVRRKILRAILQNIGGIRPPRFKDCDIAERMGVTITDAKNAKRRDFSPLPDTPEIRAMIEDELQAAGFVDITVNAFLVSE